MFCVSCFIVFIGVLSFDVSFLFSRFFVVCCDVFILSLLLILLVSSFILVFSIERDVFGMSALTVVALDVMLSVADTAVNPTIKRTIKDKKKILCLFFNM